MSVRRLVVLVLLFAVIALSLSTLSVISPLSDQPSLSTDNASADAETKPKPVWERLKTLSKGVGGERSRLGMDGVTWMDIRKPYAGYGEKLLCSPQASSEKLVREMEDWSMPSYDVAGTRELLKGLQCRGLSSHFLMTDGMIMGNLSRQSAGGFLDERSVLNVDLTSNGTVTPWTPYDYLNEAHRLRSKNSGSCLDDVSGAIPLSEDKSQEHVGLVCGPALAGVKKNVDVFENGTSRWSYLKKWAVLSKAFDKSFNAIKAKNVDISIRKPLGPRSTVEKTSYDSSFEDMDVYFGIRLASGDKSTGTSSHPLQSIPADSSNVTCATFNPTVPLVTCDARMIAFDLSRLPLRPSKPGNRQDPNVGFLKASCGLDERKWFQGLTVNKDGEFEMDTEEVGDLGLSLGGGVGWFRRFTEFLPDDEDIKCDAWIDAPLYFVDRWDTTNPYQAHQDFLNAFTSYATVRPPLDPTSARIVLLDPRQPDGPYTKAWTHIFSRSSAPPAVPYDIWDLADRVKRMVAEVGGRGDKAVVCMKRSVWGAHGGVSPLASQGMIASRCALNPLMLGMRSFMLDGWRRVNGVGGVFDHPESHFDKTRATGVNQVERGVLVSGIYDPNLPSMKTMDVAKFDIGCGSDDEAGKRKQRKTVLSVLLRTLSYPWNPSRSDRVQDLFLPFKTAKMLRHVISRAGKGHFNDVENWKQVGSRIGDTFKPSILPSLWEISDLMFSSLGQRQGKSIKFLSLPITITYAIRRLGTATSHSHAGNATSLEKGETTRRNRLLRIVTNEQQQIDLLRKRVKAWNDALEEVWDLMEDAHLVVFGGPSAAATETLNKARLDRRGGGGGRATEMEKEKCTLRRLVRPKLEFRAVDFETLSMDEQVAVAQGTDVFVGPHGAAFVHLIYLRKAPVAGVLEMQPLVRSVKNMQFRNLALGLGHLYSRIGITDSFIMNVDDVADTVMRLAASVFRERLAFAVGAV